MAITNPFSITYGDTQVGGSTDYQLHGPYVIDKSYDSLRLVFDVVVVGQDLAGMLSAADALESAFRGRLAHGDTLVITIDGDDTWTYTQGSTILDCVATIAKTGNPETDRGASRAYTVTITGGLPADADADAGLRNIEVHVKSTASRQKIVTVRGTYTATDGGDARTLYLAAANDLATPYLTAIDGAATWEMVDETSELDRHKDGDTPKPNVCNFSQQWVQLLAAQSQSGTDDNKVRDHRVVFTRLSAYPGDAFSAMHRLERVICSYDCAIDIEETTDLQGTFQNTIRPHVLSLFQTNFSPSQFAVEEQRASFDETSKRMSVSLQIVYAGAGSSNIVEVSQSVAYREQRTIDYTPVHDSDETSFEADVGWAIIERIWTRTAVVLGAETPRTRIAEWAPDGLAGRIASVNGLRSPDERNTGNEVRKEGWNVTGSTSMVTPQYIGMPDDTQILVTALTETVTERFHKKPGNGTNTGI